MDAPAPRPARIPPAGGIVYAGPMLAPPPAAARRRSRWPSRLAWAAFGAVVGATAFGLGGLIDRAPANPHAPADFAAAPPRRTASLADDRPRDGFRLVTWNIHHATGTDGVTDPARTAAALRAARFDVALLQEVNGPTAGGDDQAAALADDLRAGGAFVGTETRWGRTHRGNAVLTRLPAGPLHRVPLPDTRGKGFRTLTLTTIRTPAGTPVRVVGVHLSRGGDKPAQLAAAADLFLSLEEPCVLAGDFNTRAGDSLLDSPAGVPGSHRRPGEPAGRAVGGRAGLHPRPRRRPPGADRRRRQRPPHRRRRPAGSGRPALAVGHT